MSWGTYGILIIFGLFILLLVINPRLSCFGKRIRSPFYPLLRKRKRAGPAQKPAKTEDYGLRLTDEEKKPGDEKKPGQTVNPDAKKKAEDYGFRLD